MRERAEQDLIREFRKHSIAPLHEHLAGAASAAARAGDRPVAARSYARLLVTCEGADSPGRSELADARRFTSEAAP